MIIGYFNTLRMYIINSVMFIELDDDAMKPSESFFGSNGADFLSEVIAGYLM